MDAPRMFHPGYGSGIHRPPPPPIFQRPALLPQRTTDDDDVASHRIAHTLTACCRCRQVRMPLSFSCPTDVFAPTGVIHARCRALSALGTAGQTDSSACRDRFELTATIPREKQDVIRLSPAA